MGALQKAGEFLAQVVGLEAESQQAKAERYTAMVNDIAAGKTPKGVAPEAAIKVAAAAGKTVEQFQADVAERQRVGGALHAVVEFARLVKARDQAKAALRQGRQRRAAALAEFAIAEARERHAMASAAARVVPFAEQARSLLQEGAVGQVLGELSEACTRARGAALAHRDAESEVRRASNNVRVIQAEGGERKVREEADAELATCQTEERTTRDELAKVSAEVATLRAKVRERLRAVHGIEGPNADTMLAGFEPESLLPAPSDEPNPVGRLTAEKVSRVANLLHDTIRPILVGALVGKALQERPT